MRSDNSLIIPVLLEEAWIAGSGIVHIPVYCGLLTHNRAL